MCEVLCRNTIKRHIPKLADVMPDKRLFCRRYRMIWCCCNWLVLTMGTVCLNTFMTERFELVMKSCEKFDLLFVHIQCTAACSLEKVNFKLLYLRNYISYFNKIRRICCANIRIQSVKVWFKSVLPRLKYNIFSKGLFFLLAQPVYWYHFQ